MTEWKSIETAPRDGTTIFAANFDRGQRGLVHFDGIEWEMVNGLTNAPMGQGFYPTHWLPIPPPPRGRGLPPFSQERDHG